jgi:hypothetical protein
MTKEKNRFDLEQEILSCWNITSDLNVLLSVFDREHTEDELMNIIIGIRELYDQKFQIAFNTFEECIRKKEFKDVKF